LNVPIATWKARESNFYVEMDANVDIGNLIHDVFVVGDMVHDEHRREAEKIGIYEGPMPWTHEGLETHGNKNKDDVKATLGVGLNGESELEEFEEDIEIMGEAPEEPPFELDHSIFHEESRVPLYERVTLSGLIGVMLILNCCHTHGISNVLINEMLHLLKTDIFPQPNTFHDNENQASSTLKKLGLAYDVLHACPKGHMFYRGQYENEQSCQKCGATQFKVAGKSIVPQKVLRHFPLIPRLRRMYNTPMQTSLMTWHVSYKSGDKLVWHVVDSMQW
jgi:hypothetical protein